jgi:uncharacterized membrane protein YciS (DUF1049 family)
MTALVAVIHAGLAAGWVGGMAYSLFVVQPKLQRFFGSDQDSREALTAVIASGNRWRVLGLVAVIAATGLALLWLVDTLWWIHAIKAMLLLMATGIFWFVSCRHWPRRIFATPAEGTALQRQLRMLATTMLGLAGTAFALGVAATRYTALLVLRPQAGRADVGRLPEHRSRPIDQGAAPLLSYQQSVRRRSCLISDHVAR